MKSLSKRIIPKAYHPAARRLLSLAKGFLKALRPGADYENRKRNELRYFSQCEKVHELPAIAHYWSNKHIVPILEPFGFTNALECFRARLLTLCQENATATCSFLSIGAGSGEAEINMARWLKESGTTNFRMECLDINPDAVQKGRRIAAENGVEDFVSFSVLDFNQWRPRGKYHAVLALQSLHHVLELELLFERISEALLDDGYFMTDDMIGRNGHQRWPEALKLVEELWKELPDKYKYNHQLRQFEERFENWDCSVDGFEGIRAQDILPLLIQRFHFELFIAFGNVIDIFIDRSFGHNFDPNSEWDRNFIDRVQAIDATHLEQGLIKPTHMLAVMKKKGSGKTAFYRNLSPEFCVRSTS